MRRVTTRRVNKKRGHKKKENKFRRKVKRKCQENQVFFWM